MYTKILVPLESAELAEATLEHARILASQLQATVTPLRIITVMASDDYFMKRVQVEVGSAGAKAKAEAEEYLADLKTHWQAEGVTIEPDLLISDKPVADAIASYAEENGHDLIVMPTYQHSLVSRWLLGNVGDKVRRRSCVPVMFVNEVC